MMETASTCEMSANLYQTTERNNTKHDHSQKKIKMDEETLKQNDGTKTKEKTEEKEKKITKRRTPNAKRRLSCSHVIGEPDFITHGHNKQHCKDRFPGFLPDDVANARLFSVG